MKNFLITGATNGIGKAIAEMALDSGFHLIMIGRNEKLMKQTIDEFKLKVSNASIDYFILDFMDFKSIMDASIKIKKKYQTIDYMHLNAGALPPYKNAKTPSGHDFSMSVNFIGPLLFFEQLISLVENSNEKMVLHTTSMSASRKFKESDLNEIHTYGRIKSYATSKLFANLSFFYYASQYPKLKFRLADPGIVYTNAVTHMMPKIFKFITPLAHLISRMPSVVAREVKQIIEKNDKITIGLYRKAKLIRHNPINEDTNLQKLAMSYAHSHYKGIV